MKFLMKISDVIFEVNKVITLLAIAGYIIVMAIQVFLRNVMPDYALPWADGVCRYCFIWAAFTGAGLATKLRRHIAITLVPDMLPAQPRKALSVFNALIILAVLLITFKVGADAIQITHAQKTDSLPISIAWIYLAIPLGALISIYQLIVTTIEDLTVKHSDGQGELVK